MRTPIPLVLSLSFAALACGPNQGGPDVCHDAQAAMTCAPESTDLEALCAATFGTARPDPYVCESVNPAGNCAKPGPEAYAVCDGASGCVWCCGEPSECLPYSEQCDGPALEDVSARCAEVFGAGFSEVRTCELLEGPAGCYSLSAYSPGLRVHCDGLPLERAVWCCPP
jgi:hypothetical protein